MDTAQGRNALVSAFRRLGDAGRSSRGLATAIRFRWPILLAVSAAQVALDADGITSDVTLFRFAGERLLSSDWANAFADDDVQAGPGLLLAYGLLSRVTNAFGMSFELGLSVAVRVGLLVFVLLLTRRVCRSQGLGPSPGRQLAAGLSLLALDLPGTCYLSGHPSEVLVAGLWCHALLDMAESRPRRAGTWVALSAVIVTQGAVGVVLLLQWRPLRRALALAAGTTLLVLTAYLPFFAAGVVRTTDYSWPVSRTSLWAPLLGAGHPFPWGARLVQAAAMGIAALLALRARGRTKVSVWLIPTAVLLVRLLLDPLSYEYYWTGVQALYVVGVCAADPRHWRRDLPFYLAGYPIVLHGLAPSVLTAGVTLAAMSWAAVRAGPVLTGTPEAGNVRTVANR